MPLTTATMLPNNSDKTINISRTIVNSVPIKEQMSRVCFTCHVTPSPPPLFKTLEHTGEGGTHKILLIPTIASYWSPRCLFVLSIPAFSSGPKRVFALNPHNPPQAAFLFASNYIYYLITHAFSSILEYAN